MTSVTAKPTIMREIMIFFMPLSIVWMYSYDFTKLSKALADKSTNVPSEQFSLDCF